MYKGLEHTAIASADPEALAAWYEKYLGFPICHRYGGNVFVKAPDGTMLEIIPGEGDRPANEFKTLGIRHLAISVDDFDAAHDDLKSKGIEIENLVKCRRQPPGLFPRRRRQHLPHHPPRANDLASAPRTAR